MALDTLAFVNTREAAQAVLSIAQTGADDIYNQARFWLQNRKGSYWKGFGIDEGFAALKREVKEELVASGAFKLADIKLSPQAEKGRALYMGRGTCFVCHKMGDQGREVAPDLSFCGSKFNAAVIKEAITDPDSAVVFGYETTVIKTKDGKEFQGFLLSDHDPIVIKDLAGVDHSFPAADVVKRETSAKSLMPSAKTLNLNDEDLQAIADFLLEVAAKAKK